APLTGVYAQAVETLQSAGTDYPLLSAAITGSDGVATIPLVSSRTFDISMLSSNSHAGLAPPPVEVTLSSQETQSITLQYDAIDFHLHITAQAQTLDHGIYYCYAYDDAGHLSVNDVGTPLGQMMTLSLLSSSTWHIGCNGANETVYFSTDEFLYT